MPKIDTDQDTLTTHINEVVGKSITNDQISDLENNHSRSYTDTCETVLLNMYMVMIDAYDIKVKKVEPRLESAISLFKIDDDLVHVLSISYVKEFLSKIPTFSISEKKAFVHKIKRCRTLKTFSDTANNYYYSSANINSDVSKLLLRLYTLADSAVYNYLYYEKFKNFFEIGMPYIKISHRPFLFDLITTQPSSTIANYVQGKKDKNVECFIVDPNDDYDSNSEQSTVSDVEYNSTADSDE